MAYELQFARITNSGKLPDRFLTCQHHTGDDLTQKGMGEIFALMEMLSPWFPTAQVGQMVINNFTKYYFGGGSTSDLVNFENSLKNVNEDLAQITQNGETDWIGNLNGIIAVIVGHNLHLATTGQCEAYIFRDGKINHLTQDMSGPLEPHPLKTFINIISGELKEQDKILLANKELFNFLSLESLRQIISMNSPTLAAFQITKLLRKDKVKNTNLVIIGLGSKEEMSKEPLAENLGNVFYLDKSAESIWKNFSRIGEVGKMMAQTSGFLIKKMFSWTGAKISSRRQLKQDKDKQDVFHKEFLSGERDDSLLKDEEIKYSPDLYVHYYNTEEEKKASQAKKWSKIGHIFHWIWMKILALSQWIIDSARDRKRRKFLYIIGAAILILLVLIIVTARGKSNQIGNLEAQKILDEAISAQKEGKTLLLTGNQEQAKDKFVLSIKKAQTIENNSLVTSDAGQTIKVSQEELDKLTATTRFNDLKPLISVSENAKALFVISGQVYIISDSDIFEANLVGGTPSKVASIPKNKGDFTTGARRDKSIFLYTSDQNVFVFDTGSKKIESAKIADEARWETANAISNFVGSLYLLDGVVGQIYKHTSSNVAFSEGQEYISTVNVNLRQSIAIAIDGNIYVLKSDGQVIKIQKSKKQDFSLKNIPTPFDTIAKPLKIFTDSDTPSLYILDNEQKRIIEFDKEGQFLHQYALPGNFDKMIDFVVSAKARKIWILNDKSVYEISI